MRQRGERPCWRQWRPYGAFLVVLVSGGLLAGLASGAERAHPIRIGVLTESWGPTAQVVGLRNGLSDLGYRENEHFVIGVRFTQGDVIALPAAARELVQNGSDIIFVSSQNSAEAARMATTRIPIVFAGPGDPVGLGLIQSFARPGGNITGVSDLDLALIPKRLEIFREIIPTLRRILFLYDKNDAYAEAEARIYRDATRRLGIVLMERLVRTEKEAQAALARVRKGEVDGILVPRNVSLNIPGFVLEANVQRAIPAMFVTGFWVERGALASYGPLFYETGRQAARLVDKILKGASPAEIPAEVNPKIEFSLNLKAAKTLGLTIAPDVLYSADRLIQ